MAIEILTVCSANICRSPFAEYVLRAKLRDAPVPVTVSSAGIYAVGGSSMEHFAQELATKWGAVDVSDHRSARVTVAGITGAALVLTATRSQSAALVNACPDAAHKVFTIREFGYSAATLSDAQLQASAAQSATAFAELVKRVDGVRSKGMSEISAQFDVPDPFGGGQEYYEHAQELMIPGLDQVVRLVTAAAGA